MLAFLGENYLQTHILSKAFPIFTENTIRDESTLRVELEAVRQNGYALDNEEIILGIRCIAAPIFVYQKNVIGAIGITKLAPSINDDNFDKIVASVRDAANQISY
ncbi:MAG: hypothetical protein GX775_05665 [Erysipelothrix sp.]|nr:hypothetical protein [Erysipelothrix sp.]